jgi:hypothetical protein
MVATIILLIAGLVFFLVAAVVGHAGPAEGPGPMWGRTNFVALGLACWIVTAIIAAFPG